MILWIAGVSAVERGSEYIEPKDLLKGIYVVDLEHVAQFWESWEQFEHIISTDKLANGVTVDYINRTLYLVRVYVAANEGGALFARRSLAVNEIIARAKRFAVERSAVKSPTSRDLLFSIVGIDRELSSALEESGLKLSELEAAVKSK